MDVLQRLVPDAVAPLTCDAATAVECHPPSGLQTFTTTWKVMFATTYL